MKSSPFMALILGTACLTTPALLHAAGKPQQKGSENQTSAVGEFWLGYSFLNPGSTNVTPGDENYLGLGGDLRINIPAGGDLNFQIDLQSETGFVDDTTSNYTGSVLGGLHLSWREPTDWLLGGFVGAGNGFNADDETATAWLLGAEAQYYLSDWTLYGQVGYMDADEADAGTPDAFRDAWFLRGVGRYFIDSNVKLEGELSYATGEQETSGGDMDVWGWGLRYERAISSMDSSFFVAYEGNHYNSDADNPSNELTEHVVKLGLSVAFGIEGQKYIDRHGATLDLPMVTRWSAYGVDVVN